MATTEALKSGNFLSAFGVGNLNFGTLGTILLIVFVIILVGGVLSAIGIWWYYRRLYSQTIVIYGKVGNLPALKRIDKGRYVKFGSAGDNLMHLKGLKKYISPPTIQMGKNTWWYWERKDGELINIGLADIDEEMKRAGAYFVDMDMRMQRLGIEKNLRERLENKGFWSKYGSTIAGAVFIILVTVALVVLFSKLVSVAESINNMATQVGRVAESIDKLYAKREGGLSPNEVNGGSGLVPALAPLVFLYFRRKKWH